MTNTHFSKQQTSSQPSFMSALRRHAGISWLAVWLLVAGTFGYRALTHETAGQAVASVGATGLHDGSSKSLKPIERIEVGERVAFAINPTEGFDDSLGTEIHAHAWRKIELRPDAHSRVVLLRPEWWVNERIQDDSQTMAISIPEVGIHGDAEIVSITPCPRIPAGEGRVVIGTFSHLAQETIRLTINGVSEPIRCTPNHATWSVEARAFVEAQDLQPGQHVLCRDGIYEVAKIEHLPEPIEVFNLEVFGQHVYQITTGGMLVHNVGPAGSGMVPGTGRGLGAKAPDQVTPGIRQLDGQYVDDVGQVQPYRAQYDQYGRQIERTDFTNLPSGTHTNPHHHTRDYAPEYSPYRDTTHPGPGPMTGG